MVTTISARPLAAMLPEEALPDRLMRRLRIWRYSTAAFKLDYALRAPVPWTAPRPARRPWSTSAASCASSPRRRRPASAARCRSVPRWSIGQHTLFDPSRAPAGQHTLYCYAHVPARYDCSDEEIAALVEAQLERFAPGFADTVLARAIRNPAADRGREPEPGRRRPRRRLATNSTSSSCSAPPPSCAATARRCVGLYVTGASVHPGGSVQGMGGRSAARALLADRRLRPWRA